MGAWGTKLYQDDVACDVKEEYLNRLRVGYTNEEATKEVIEYNSDFINDIDDGPVFWLALADTQWKYGRLLPEVKEEAIKIIEQQTDLLKWKENKKQYQRRKEELEKLKEKLNTPQSPEKKVTKIKMNRATWKIGDVLAYQIKAEEFKDTKWYHKYILFRVIGITKTNIGSLPENKYYDEQNVVAIYNWYGDGFPNIDIIKDLDFLIIEKIYYKFDPNTKLSSEIKRLEISKAIFSFNSRELKKLDIKVLMHDEKYIQPEENNLYISWYNVNNIDWLVYDFERAVNKKDN